MRAEAQSALAEGNRLRASGRIPEAVAAYRRAIDRDLGFGAAHYNLGIALRQAGDWLPAALAFRTAARLDPTDFDAIQNVITMLGEAVKKWGQTPFPAEKRGQTPIESAPNKWGQTPFSILVCSVDEARLAAMKANYTRALGTRPHEFVVIRDARSLAEGYQRALAQARYDQVLFTHDDVELVSAHPFEALDHALEEHDIVGLAGATRVTGPAVLWAGHPHLHGWIAYPGEEGGWEANVHSLETGTIAGAQSLDGVFFATRRDLARQLGFDAATFDGFHFYDLDFTYRAHREGRRLAITTDIAAIHASRGTFADDWQGYAARFTAKFPEASQEPPGPHHAYAAHFDSREEILAFHDALRTLGATP